MNIPNFYAAYAQMAATGDVSLSGFGTIRLTSRNNRRMYIRVNETPSRLRVHSRSNNVWILDGDQWLDTGQHAELVQGAQTGATVLATIVQVANALGITIPMNEPAATGSGTGNGNGTSNGNGGDNDGNLPTLYSVPTVPLAAGAAAGYFVGKRYGRPFVGALAGLVAGYFVGKGADPTDQWDYTFEMPGG